ncbi:organellar and viral DNA polymerase type B, partial [Trichomonas vaginalis G3]|uniref:organellar and viral DNA polymerase type B n=1 Tax=Trichomonas vaginalis (strain ATCC PRA-98 / G3) TaxID=412133 RepID=UPI0021E5FF34
MSTIGTTTIQTTTAPNSLVMNPTSMLVEMKSFIPSSYTFETKIQKIKQELLTSNLDCSAKDETNEQYLYEMQDIIDHLPKLPEIQQQKLTIPEFDEIEVRLTDSVEIKKFIRKVNYEFLGFHCNHKVMDIDLYKSEEFKTYDNFVSLVAKCVWEIRDKDSRGKVWNEQIKPAMFEMKKTIDALVILAGKISMYNAKMNPQCSKCKAAMRKYNYSVKEIERMRNDYADLKKEMTNNEFETVGKIDNETKVVRIGDLNVRYSKKYNKYSLSDILSPSGKKAKDWVRIASSQKILTRNPELMISVRFYGTTAYLIDKSLIPIVLLWLDPVVGYNFITYGSFDSERCSEGLLYIVQKPKDFNTKRYKIGRTFNITQRYDSTVNRVKVVL